MDWAVPGGRKKPTLENRSDFFRQGEKASEAHLCEEKASSAFRRPVLCG
jgi:hypothetical protein